MCNIHSGMVIYLKLRQKIGLNPNHYDLLFDNVARACLLPPQAESYTEKDVQFNGHLWFTSWHASHSLSSVFLLTYFTFQLNICTKSKWLTLCPSTFTCSILTGHFSKLIILDCFCIPKSLVYTELCSSNLNSLFLKNHQGCKHMLQKVPKPY